MALLQKFKLKHLKLNLLAFFLILFLGYLGYWQLSRALEKEALLQTYEKKIQLAPRHFKDVETISDPRFYNLKVQGHFDNAHNILLDNKILAGQVGYGIYTPFIVKESAKVILVDRGFISMGASRRALPKVPDILGEKTIIGMLNLPPRYMALGKMNESSTSRLVEYIDLKKLSHTLNLPFFNYILVLQTTETPLKIVQEIVTITPERHRGYALQWFALALTLLILSLVLNYKSA